MKNTDLSCGPSPVTVEEKIKIGRSQPGFYSWMTAEGLRVHSNDVSCQKHSYCFTDVACLSSLPNQHSSVHFLLSFDKFLSEGFGRLINHHSSLAHFKGRSSGQSPWEVLRGHFWFTEKWDN